MRWKEIVQAVCGCSYPGALHEQDVPVMLPHLWSASHLASSGKKEAQRWISYVPTKRDSRLARLPKRELQASHESGQDGIQKHCHQPGETRCRPDPSCLLVHGGRGVESAQMFSLFRGVIIRRLLEAGPVGVEELGIIKMLQDCDGVL